MLSDSIFIDPVNVFLYTWQFLPTLLIEESSTLMSKMYHWYRQISIWIVPTAFLGLYTGLVIVTGKMFEYYSEGNLNEYIYWHYVYEIFLRIFGYFTLIVNCLSCAILFLTIRHAYKLTKIVEEFH
jgi:hypothetical protein